MDTEYLKSDFDANGVKVADLRRILTENEVEFASNAKKGELVKLFEDEVRPKISRLRRKYENLLPSDQGIVKVASKRKGKVKGREKKKAKVLKTKVKKGTKDEVKDPEKLSISGDDESSSVQSSEEPSVEPSLGPSVKSEIEEAKELTPFSEVNEFQQGKLCSSIKAVSPDGVSPIMDNNSGAMEVGTPIKDEGKEGEIDSKNTKKRRRRIGDDQNTPITKKVAKKSPQKSPHRSLIIEKFESSSSDSSFNNSSVLNISNAAQPVIHVEGTPEKALSAGTDFSYRRKTISPDLSKLKVSAAFAEQLKNAVKENPVNEPFESEAESDLDSLSRNSVRISRKGVSTAQNDEHLSSTGRDDDEAELSSQETIKSLEVVKNDSSTPEIISTRDQDQDSICSPDLPSHKDVQDSETRVEKIKDILDEVIDPDEPKLASLSLRVIFKGIFKFLVNVLLFLLCLTPLLYGLWYRQQRIFTGFCGNEKDLLDQTYSNVVLNYADKYLGEFKPQCIPCPSNAICYPYLEIKCKPDYALFKNSWNLHGLLPLPDYCVKDSKREKLISEVVQKSLEFLRAKNAIYECGECTDESKSGISEEELYQIFYEARAPWLNDDDFNELWVQAISDLENEPEITWRQVSITLEHELLLMNSILTKNLFFSQLRNSELAGFGNSNNSIGSDDIQRKERHISKTDEPETTRFFRSTSKKYISLRCKFEREIYQNYYRFRYLLWGVVLTLILVKTVDYKLRKYYREKKNIENLTKKVILRLREAKREHTATDGVAFLSTVQLRDVFLADIMDLSYKNVLWQKVAKKLEHNNTNIKSSLMEIHGEIMKCWEWIGPLDDSLSQK